MFKLCNIAIRNSQWNILLGGWYQLRVHELGSSGAELLTPAAVRADAPEILAWTVEWPTL